MGYYYIDKRHYGIVWFNILVFILLHLAAFYGLNVFIQDRPWKTFLFTYFLGIFNGLGVTAGAHRLWSHRSYKARLPLRIFLATCFTLAGQNDLLTWCRDHRVHHKYSETDADPHNSKRGFFFAHVGWLLTRKHPDVKTKGKNIDISDLLKDPVVVFQKRHFVKLYILLNIVIPTLIPCIFWNESYSTAFMMAVAWRYVVSLHNTWFVNSAAHMWGGRPYRKNIGARENIFVSFGALGEGFHNYHHTFPFDYATSELGWTMNFTKMFIDFMAWLGLAYDLTTLKQEKVASIRALCSEGDIHHKQEANKIKFH